MEIRLLRSKILWVLLALPVFALSFFAGEWAWQNFLQDLLGQRPIAECVNLVYARELRPPIEALVADFWEEHHDPKGLLIEAPKIFERAESRLATPEKIDALASSVNKTTSCHNLDAIYWQISISLPKAIRAFAWEAISPYLR